MVGALFWATICKWITRSVKNVPEDAARDLKELLIVPLSGATAAYPCSKSFSKTNNFMKNSFPADLHKEILKHFFYVYKAQNSLN